MPPPRELDPTASLAAFFGAEVRRLRTANGWTLDQMADMLGWGLSTVASVETARRSPPHGFPERADALFGLPAMLTHLAELARMAPHWLDHYVEFEKQAGKISLWIMNVIPGLFQTDAYARALLRAARPNEHPERIEADVTERLQRQSILDRPDPPHIWAVLHECAVKQPIGGVEIMQVQLSRLLELAKRPNITVQILPFTAGAYPASSGPFTILEFVDQPPVAFVEGGGRTARIIDEREELTATVEAYDQLRAAALSAEASIGMIVGAMGATWIDRTP
ncbi:helix-turn-helix transcriptional regulator [Actinoallomurus acanthiterrae]